MIGQHDWSHSVASGRTLWVSKFTPREVVNIALRFSERQSSEKKKRQASCFTQLFRGVLSGRQYSPGLDLDYSILADKRRYKRHKSKENGSRKSVKTTPSVVTRSTA